MAKKFYAVKAGFKTGLFTSWDEVKKVTTGFKGAKFKGFEQADEAQAWLDDVPAKVPVTGADVIAYVDGSELNDVRGYGSGVVIVAPTTDTILAELSFADNEAAFIESKQIAGEINATLAALDWAIVNGKNSIEIKHDYIGIASWALGEWKANTAIAKYYIAEVTKRKAHVTIYFTKVAAHTGVQFNERADQLAKASLNRLR